MDKMLLPGQFSGRRDDPYCSNGCSSKTTSTRDFILVSFFHPGVILSQTEGLLEYIEQKEVRTGFHTL